MASAQHDSARANRPHAVREAGQVSCRRTPIDILVGERLRGKRLERRLQQHDLANLIHVPIDTITAYEQGDQRVDPAHLLQFGVLLGVDIAYFFTAG